MHIKKTKKAKFHCPGIKCTLFLEYFGYFSNMHSNTIESWAFLKTMLALQHTSIHVPQSLFSIIWILIFNICQSLGKGWMEPVDRHFYMFDRSICSKYFCHMILVYIAGQLANMNLCCTWSWASLLPSW